jgi:catechol 2,3-dioxygenase-like lactoylglutathione lyase family enzyme
MAVRRIVPNISGNDPALARAFYADLFDLELAMDHGWIVTFAGDATTTPQISVAQHAGSGAPFADLSIEVDNLEDVLKRAKAQGYTIEYGPADEPWGVRRFFLRDPFGKMVNVLQHV